MSNRERTVHFLAELQAMIKKGEVVFNVNPFLDQEYAENYIANIRNAVSEAIRLLSDSKGNVQSED